MTLKTHWTDQTGQGQQKRIRNFKSWPEQATRVQQRMRRKISRESQGHGDQNEIENRMRR